MAALQLGFRSTVTPISPVPEHTRYFPAGALTFGLEHRLLNADIIRSTFASGSADRRHIETIQTLESFDDEGLSVHVFDTQSRVEYLRFDMFGEDPHYHYIHPGVDNIVVVYDRHANGPMWEWTIAVLRKRLTEMLTYAGATALAAGVDQALVANAVDEMVGVVGELRHPEPAR